MPGAAVGDADHDFPASSLRRNGDGRILGRVLEGVFQKLLDHLLRQLGIGFGRGQIGRRVDGDGAALAQPLHFGQRAGDDLLHRHLPLFQVQLAGFDARHRHHFRGELIQTVGFFVDDGQQLAVGRRGFAEQVGDGGFDRGQRRLDIVRQRIEQRRFQQLALPRGFGVAGFLHGARLFDGDGGQVGDGAHHLRGRQRRHQAQAAQAPHAQADGAGHPVAGRFARSVLDLRRDFQVVLRDRLALRAGAEDLVRLPVKKSGSAAAKFLRHAVEEFADGLARVAGEGERPHQRIEPFAFEAAGFRFSRAAPGPRRKLAGGGGGHQEGDKRHQVLRILNGEFADRRQEIEIEPEHRQHRGEGGLGQSPPGGNAEDGQQQRERHGGVVDRASTGKPR